MTTIALATLGCKVNQYESASFTTGLLAGGARLVPFSSKADLYIINTCTVTGRAGQQSRQLIRRAMRTNPEARIIVTGCYAQMAPEEVLSLADGPVTIVGNGNKHLLVETALATSKADLVMLMGDIGRKRDICTLPVQSFRGRTRAYLRIQDGCNNFCSYCIVPYVRGRSRSLPLADVLAQAAVFIEQGYRELVITGINVGKYGLDLAEQLTIYGLLDRLCLDFPDTRIRLSSLEPTEINDRLLAIMGVRANFMPHLHIPLQSGDDQILMRMNRRYNAEFFVGILERLISNLPDIAIGCDVLGGFPGETDAQAENTYRLLAGLPIAYLHVFPYSSRPGTLAASFGDQVPGPIRDARVARLRQLSDDKKQAFQRRHLGSTCKVLVERRNRHSGLLQGFSENYLHLNVQGPSSLIHQVAAVRFDKVVDGQAHGTVLAQPGPENP
jgi:threonylcarbamoyladenosine tRNA methylthiotransferase MtaB